MNTKYPGKPHNGLSLCVLEPGQKVKRASPKETCVIKIGKQIIFDPNVMNTYYFEDWKPIHYDLLVVSAAIEYADRHLRRHINQWSRNFRITVPVFELARWKKLEVQESLRATLRHLTGDDWEFSFIQLRNQPIYQISQRNLPYEYLNKQFVIAYSDGLDSHCVSYLCGQNDGALRVRITKSLEVSKKGKDKFFEEIPFKVVGKDHRESSFRSRGFKFASITAIVAQISKLKKIIVPESGQGALGPILVPLNKIYPDYRNHPTYFRKMEVFIESLLEYELSYEQPRLWHTKGQTIRECLEKTDSNKEYLIKTRSCWQRRWNVSVPNESQRQCGLCVACLLRRMSMHEAGITEYQDTYLYSNLTVSYYKEAISKDLNVVPKDTMVGYGVTGARYLQHLADMSRLSDEKLSCDAFEIAGAISESQSKTLEQLKIFLNTHAQEWHKFMELQGKQSFLRDWTSGGLND